MHLLERLARGHLRLNRIEAFSDGVFAIVVTLLVLELTVPEPHGHGSVAEPARQLVGLVPGFLSWLISFIIVCKFWLSHHHVLGLAGHANYALVWLNSLFLMLQSFIPFPTAMMDEYATNPLAVTASGIVMAFNTLLIALHAYILRNLIQPERAQAQDPHIIRKSFVGVFSYSIGAAAAWLSVYMSFAIYLLTPVFFIVPPTRRDVGTASAGSQI